MLKYYFACDICCYLNDKFKFARISCVWKLKLVATLFIWFQWLDKQLDVSVLMCVMGGTVSISYCQQLVLILLRTSSHHFCRFQSCRRGDGCLGMDCWNRLVVIATLHSWTTFSCDQLSFTATLTWVRRNIAFSVSLQARSFYVDCRVTSNYWLVAWTRLTDFVNIGLFSVHKQLAEIFSRQKWLS